MDSDNTVPEGAGASVRENPPRENLVRAVMPGVEYRDASSADDGLGLMTGEFSRFNEWTEINSSWEGNFLERIGPSAFDKTFAENRNNMRVLYDHGHDPSIGNKPLGPIRDLRSTDTGAYYEVPLFDTSYNRDLLPALKAGQLGASFRFKVVREDWNKTPERSEFNPRGLPERTIVEAKVMEFGPVTFPAYAGASAGVRSMTDEFITAELFGDQERLRALLSTLLPASSNTTTGHVSAPSDPTPPAVAPRPKERRDTPKFENRKDWLEWISRI